MSSLRRDKPLRPRPRGKGARGEREIIDIFKAHGWKEARRNFGSGSQGGGDITGGPAGTNVEVKFRETTAIWQWIEQSEHDARPTDVPLVIFRRSRSQWYAVIPLEELLPLLALREKGL